MRFLVAALGLVACARGDAAHADGHLADASRDARERDANDDASDATLDGSPSPGAALLLSEIALSPTAGEFVEIVNPTTQAVDLSTYYLSDNGNYFKLPAGTPTLSSADFIAQFPAGAMIAPSGVVTVAIGSAAGFTTTYGIAPTYSVGDATMTVTVKQGTPTLTDAGELVVLFQWDGSAGLVHDVDIMLAGVPSAGNGLVSKSNYAQGGATYAADANTIAAQPSAPATGKSTKRTALETGHETQTGAGNGIDGDDETSEATSATWDTAFTAPTPGQSLVP